MEETTAAKRAVDSFVAVQTDGTYFCPRCGRWTMKDRLHTSALSRYVHVYICDECEMDEALRELYGMTCH